MEPHMEYYCFSFAILDKGGIHKSLLALYYRKTERKSSGTVKCALALQAEPEICYQLLHWDPFKSWQEINLKQLCFILSDTKGINLLTHSVSWISKIHMGCWTQLKLLSHISRALTIESNSTWHCSEPKTRFNLNQTGTLRHVQKEPCHCLYKGSAITQLLQNYHAKLSVILWVFSFSITHIFVYLLIRCKCENCT